MIVRCGTRRKITANASSSSTIGAVRSSTDSNAWPADVANTGKFTTVGVVALVASLLIALTNIESIFNRIWRVKTARPRLSRFLVYWTMLTLGALVAATSLALSTRFFSLAEDGTKFWKM